MSDVSRHRSRAPAHARARSLSLVLLAALAIAGCGGDSGGTAGPGPSVASNTLVGIMAFTNGRVGKISLTLSGDVQPSVGRPQDRANLAVVGVLDVTGTVELAGGGTITITGTWDTTTGAVSLSGGGYSFTGTYSAGRLTGSFTGPGVEGVFELRLTSSSSAVTIYCGTFTGRDKSGTDDDGPDDGTWNMAVGTGSLNGAGVSDGGTAFAFEGTRSGNSVSISISGVTASGTLAGSANEFVNGNYTVLTGGSGTFQGSAAACSASAQAGVISSITINQPGVIQAAGGAERLAFDSVLAFATAKDAAGKYVAEPDLTWTRTGKVHFNATGVRKGTIWVIPDSTSTVTITATSTNGKVGNATFSVP
jgi:hypothetical protein